VEQSPVHPPSLAHKPLGWGDSMGGGQPQHSPPQIISAPVEGGRKAGFSLHARELSCPSWDLCSDRKASDCDSRQGAACWGKSSSIPPRAWGHGGYRAIAPQAAWASLPASKTGSSRANRDIEEEIIGRGGILQCPSLHVYFPSCCHFCRPPPWSSFIPTFPSLSPALIPSLPAHAVVLSSLFFSFSLSCFFFLPSF